MSPSNGTDGDIAAAGRRAYAPLVRDTAPVAWWPLASNLDDRAGARNAVLGAGSEVHATGLPANSSGSFDCAGANWLEVTHADALKPSAGTVMVWFKPASLHGCAVIQSDEAGAGTNPNQFTLNVQTDGTIALFLAGMERVTARGYYDPGQVVHALVTFDSSGVALYLDGKQIGTDTGHSAGLTGNTLNWRFGRSAVDTVFDGVIGHIAIWDRVLSDSTEIPALAQVATAAANANRYPDTGRSSVGVGSGSVNIGEALAAAVNAATAGQHILIRAGTYTGGTAKFKNKGTEFDPIVIRPEGDIGTVTINDARWTLEKGSERLVLSQLFFEDGSRIEISGKNHRVDRCRFRQVASPAIKLVSSTDGRISRCDFADYLSVPEGKAMVFLEPEGFDDKSNVGNLIDHCYFHDIVPTVGQNGTEIIRTFAQPQNMDLDIDVCTVDHCLFQNIDLTDEENEIISIKSGGWTVRFCTFEDCRKLWLNTRTANNCEIRSNWFEKISAQAGAGLSIKGKNHLVIGNRCKGGVNIACNRGDGTAAQVMAGEDIGIHPKAENCRFVGNRLESGTILVGTIDSGAGTQEAALSNNIPISPTTGGNSRESGGDPHKLDKTGGASGTTFDADPESFTLPDRKLTPEEVGLKAPDPLS